MQGVQDMSALIPKKLLEEGFPDDWPKVHIVFRVANPEELAKFVQDSMMQVYGRGRFREPTKAEKKDIPEVKRVMTDFDVESVNIVPKGPTERTEG